jgi:hypothetical protein
MPIESLGTDVAMTEPPKGREDISLTVSRIWHKNGEAASIFLDVQCRSYAPGQEDTCRTDARSQVLRGFRSALEQDDMSTEGTESMGMRTAADRPPVNGG